LFLIIVTRHSTSNDILCILFSIIPVFPFEIQSAFVMRSHEEVAIVILVETRSWESLRLDLIRAGGRLMEVTLLVVRVCPFVPSKTKCRPQDRNKNKAEENLENIDGILLLILMLRSSNIYWFNIDSIFMDSNIHVSVNNAQKWKSTMLLKMIKIFLIFSKQIRLFLTNFEPYL